MGKRKVSRKGRSPWPPFVVEKAVELLAATRNVTEARKLLGNSFQFDGDPPARSTLQGWARRADIVLDVDELKTRDTTAATEARLARLDDQRQELSEVLLERLTRPAAEEIARRLQEAQEAEALVTTAREAYQDALKMVSMTRDAMSDKEPAEVRAAVREAMVTVKEARRELAFALDFRIDIRELVGVVTRGLGDHLALEGLALGEDDDQAGDIIVEHHVPRPDRRKADEQAVPQAKLKLVEGGAS